MLTNNGPVGTMTSLLFVNYTKMHPVDELFVVRSGDDFDAQQVVKYFNSLARSVLSGEREVRRSECEEFIDTMSLISNEFSWLTDDFHKLVQAFEETASALEYYRELVVQRLTDEEKYELNAIKVKQALEQRR